MHAVLRMLRCIVFKLLFDGGEGRAFELCEYMCHGETSSEATIIAIW
jgi:hypothetical protein